MGAAASRPSRQAQREARFDALADTVGDGGFATSGWAADAPHPVLEAPAVSMSVRARRRCASSHLQMPRRTRSLQCRAPSDWSM
jgi:hypothetical protein